MAARPVGSAEADADGTEEEDPKKFIFRVPMVTFNDFALSANGNEAALATRHRGAVLAKDLGQSTEGRPLELNWSHVAAPQLWHNVSRVAFSSQGHGRQQLALSSGRAVCITDVGAGSGSMEQQGSRAGYVGAVRSCLSAHLGPVTAMDWSPHTPNLLATCAEDCRFFVWDTRKQQPAQSLLSPASWTASVRWAALSEFLLATGHEDTLCIWDIRNASQHMSVLAPGQSRILAVDWSLHDSSKLLSVSALPGSARGSIKVWDLDSTAKVHESIDIENGMPGFARFLPFGPAVLAAVESSLVVFKLPSGGSRRATVVKEFHGHSAPISSVAFACGAGASVSECLFASVSQAERCIRGWRFRLTEAMQETLVPTRGFTLADPVALVAASCTIGSHTSIASGSPSPNISPVLGPVPLPGAGARTPARKEAEDWPRSPEPKEEARSHETQYLGWLARHSARLRCLNCVDEVTSCWQALAHGVEYQLLIEVTVSEIRLRITISIDPTAPQARAVQAHVEWADVWADTFDGPLAPGAIDETFRALSLASLEGDGDELCSCVQALERMLLRRDGPPRLVGGPGADGTPIAPPAPRVKGELPFPRTCGLCWSPHGDLLCFRSLRNVQVPFPRRWTSGDLGRVLKIHSHKELCTLLQDDDSEHSRVANKLKIDCSVHFTPATALCGLVEDHWWTAAIASGPASSTPAHALEGGLEVEVPNFLLEPCASAPSAAALCEHNFKSALAFGRRDLAQVWRLLAVLADNDTQAAEGLRGRPFAAQLVKQVVLQLFNAQETLALAVIGMVLMWLVPPPRQTLARGERLEGTDEPSDNPLKRGRGRRRAKPVPPLPSECRERVRVAMTWSFSSKHPMDLTNVGRGRGSAGSDDLMQKFSHSNESTLSCSASPMQPPPAHEASDAPSAAPPLTPVVRHAVFEEGLLEDLVLRDMPTLDRLVHSAHAHCDLLHRLGRFSASRALAKLLRKLQSRHELPPLGADDALFGDVGAQPGRRTTRAASDAGSVQGGSAQVGDAELPAFSLETGDIFDWPATLPSGTAKGSPDSSTRVCAICGQRVQRLYAPCWVCGHGFHVVCLRRWFTSSAQKCPATGCECHCQHNLSLRVPG